MDLIGGQNTNCYEANSEAKGPCSVEGCARPSMSRGWCSLHYQRLAKKSGVVLNPKHGESGAPEYRAWSNMLTRCFNSNCSYFKYYGGRGITVFEEWQTSYEAFLAHVGRRPSPQHSLDRHPDKDGNYEPGNTRWATRKGQQNNTRRNRLVTINGETHTVSEWAALSGIREGTIAHRAREGWPEVDMLRPVDRSHYPLKEQG